ncbi:biotin-dependent carboxyltransferase family protein [Staphylococcus caeli]|uniref:5-oxoprolinase subunit C family protein n=1 Tax=Staphylococcus caeli TaxID=2201815 RepID=UPI003F56B2CD
MSIKILNPGLFSTIQDEGRIGYQAQGFSTAGALDIYAFRLAQTLINNEGPAIECTMFGPTIQFLTDNTFVVTGAHFDTLLNEKPVKHQTVIAVKRGDILALNSATDGARAYITFGKPLDMPLVANSYSTHTHSKIGGYQGRALKSGDIIQTKILDSFAQNLGISSNAQVSVSDTVHVIEGPQIDCFSDEAKEKLTSTTFKISEKSDRMGYRLQGPNIAPEESADIISEPVALGSIQVPDDGNPIILLNDKQTVGGYTKIATVCLADLDILAQKKPSETINFQWISVEQATERFKEKERLFVEKQEQVLKTPVYDLSQMRNTSTRLNKLLKGEL